MSGVEEVSDAESEETRRHENSPATSEDDNEAPPLKRARVEKGRKAGGEKGRKAGGEEQVVNGGEQKEVKMEEDEAREVKKEEEVEMVTAWKEEGEKKDPVWINELSAVNKALLRSFLARQDDEIRAEVEGKTVVKPAICLLFEILIGVFKCHSRITVDGEAQEFSASLELCPSIIVTCAQYRSKRQAKMECAKMALEALLSMSVESMRVVKEEEAEDTVVGRKEGTVAQRDSVSINGVKKEDTVSIDDVKKEDTVSIADPERRAGCAGYRCEVQRPRADGAMAQTTLSNLLQEQAYAMFHKLAQTCPAAANTHRVLAAMFLQDHAKGQMHCISLATGNKCIKASSLSFEGRAVHDCHAEILTRRGLVRWLYSQVALARAAPERSALVRDEGEGEEGKMRLRKRFSLHLFISTAPCGDGRVYQFGSTKNKDYNNVGRLRHKIEDGEGTVLGEKEDERLSIDSFAMGQRLRTMSCSDKVLKWNVLGLQGALLSHFLHPIYLSSLTLAHFTRASCIARACYGRAAGFVPSEKEYMVNTSLALRSSTFFLPNTMSRARPKSSNVSANWNATDGGVELIDTRSGRAMQAQDSGLGAATSRLSKISMLTRFAALVPGEGSIKYTDAKRSATGYSKTRAELIHYLEEEAKLGQWQSKPNDYSQVEVE